MNEFDGCPFCGNNPIISFEVNKNIGVVFATAKCPWCGCDRTAVALIENGDVLKAKHKALDGLVDVWNIRKKEAHKESNVEWALKKIKKGDFHYSVCHFANYIKNRKPCLKCSKCEFQDEKNAINYLLAPREEKDHD